MTPVLLIGVPLLLALLAGMVIAKYENPEDRIRVSQAQRERKLAACARHQSEIGCRGPLL